MLLVIFELDGVLTTAPSDALHPALAHLLRLREEGRIKLAIWSAGTRTETTRKLAALFPPRIIDCFEFIFNRSRCAETRKGLFVKNLEVVWEMHPGFQDNTLIIDTVLERIPYSQRRHLCLVTPGDPRALEFAMASILEAI